MNPRVGKSSGEDTVIRLGRVGGGVAATGCRFQRVAKLRRGGGRNEHIQWKTRQEMYVYRNIEARLCDS